jgi:hypothetical protein
MRRFVEGVDRKLAFRAWVQRGQSRIVLFSVGLLCCSIGDVITVLVDMRLG